MEDHPDGMNGLRNRLELLETRVYALEHPAGLVGAAIAHVSEARAATDAVETLPAATAVGAFSLSGRAMLGVAGAYLLRAVAESHMLPSAVVASVAIAYALAWLVWASRAKSGEWLTATVYSLTSALILVPMLWELMLRFNVLPVLVTAGIVAGFAATTSILTWKHEMGPVLWVGNLTALGLALALSIASHAMIPFTAVLLLMVMISEWRATRGRGSGVRIVVSLAADAAVWALIFIYSGPGSARANYPQLGAAILIAPGVMLFLISGAGVVYRTLQARKRITAFDTVQATAAFLLAAGALIDLGPPRSVIGLGIACLIMAAAGYAVTLSRFGSDIDGRNLLVFASWSGALAVAGSLMCIPLKVQAPWMGTWALAASWTGARLLRLHLQAHGLVFLVVAAIGSGLLNWMADELAGTPPDGTGWAVYLVIVCAVGCYASVALPIGSEWKNQAVAIAFALLAAGALTALVVHGSMGLMALRMIPGAHHRALVRTLVVCVAAIGLTFCGARWGRAELTKIGYGALALLVLKLVLEDLRHGQLAFIAASISLFAITLIAVPRVARMKQRVSAISRW